MREVPSALEACFAARLVAAACLVLGLSHRSRAMRDQRNT